MEKFRNLSEEGKVFMSLIERLESDLSELKNRATSDLSAALKKRMGDIVLTLKYLETEVQELKHMTMPKALLEKKFKEYRSLTNQNLSDLSKYLKGLINSQIEDSYNRYYAIPETKDDQVCLITQTQNLSSLNVKLDTAVTPADGQNLSIDILVNGSSMLDSPIVIDDSLEAGKLKEFRLPNKKLFVGDVLELELTHNSGTLNTLSGIWMALKYKTILSLAS